MWSDLTFQIVEFWKEHKIGGTFIGIVVSLIFINGIIDLYNWIL